LKRKKVDTAELLTYLLLAVTLGIFGPLELYFTNIDEFWFSLGHIWWIILLGGLLLFAGCYLVGLFFKGKKGELYLCLLFGLGLAFYIQGNFINADYKVLDGKSIDWSAYTGTAIVNTVIWVLCLIVPFVLRSIVSRNWKKIIVYVAAIILLIQVSTLTVLGLITDSNNKNNTTAYLTTEGQYDLSKNKNIVIFILDAFDSSYFMKLLDEYPELKTSFSDFTYYPDTVGGATRTTLAIPFIMTGKAWTEPVSYNEYLEKAFSEAELYDVLTASNYDIRVYTDSSYIPSTQIKTISNFEIGGMKVRSNYLLFKYFYKLTAFRYMPHLLKSPFWLYGEVFNELKGSDNAEIYKVDDAKFYQSLINNGLSGNSMQNALRIYHLKGAHPPYNMNEHAEKVSSSETSRQQQTRGVLKIVEEYIPL